ncbi:MAG: phosphonate ABC transporter, permease protein PhnE [Trueperaceae bacterium]
MTSGTKRRTWSPPPLIRNPWLRWGLLLGGVAYLLLAGASIEIDGARIAAGWPRTQRLFGDFFRPDFVTRWTDIRIGLLESITMTVVSTAVGVVLAVPVSLGAARNLAPTPVYLMCRAFVILARTFPEVIVALVFVVMVGFGPLAGVITLTLASIGFIAKLLAEDIEEIDAEQLEALRATGASTSKVILYAVVPQVTARFIGLSAYRLDINFRESAILGIVGAGGIGATLRTSMQRYDFDTAGAILALVIVIVLLLEFGSSVLRKWVQ